MGDTRSLDYGSYRGGFELLDLLWYHQLRRALMKMISYSIQKAVTILWASEGQSYVGRKDGKTLFVLGG